MTVKLKPKPLKAVAYLGYAKRFIELVGDQTEADPAALLIQFLTMFGNFVGRDAEAHIGSLTVPLNLFSLVVGQSSKARKGTSLGLCEKFFREVDPQLVKECVRYGLSSGEGLIKHFGGTGDQLIERLLAIESEFGQVLKVATRDGNTLSSVLRNAFDGKPLGLLTKKDPVQIDEHLTSVIAHITLNELKHDMKTRELFNGFANRFIFIYAERSRVLSRGGRINQLELKSLAANLRDRLAKIAFVRSINFSTEALELWDEAYPALSRDLPYLLGSVTARAETHVIKLAALYALLDDADVVATRHLLAGLEVWRYAFETCRYIYGDAIGIPLADKILDGLRACGPLSLSEIVYKVCKKNYLVNDIEDSLNSLIEFRLIEKKDETYCPKYTVGYLDDCTTNTTSTLREDQNRKNRTSFGNGNVLRIEVANV